MSAAENTIPDAPTADNSNAKPGSEVEGATAMAARMARLTQVPDSVLTATEPVGVGADISTVRTASSENRSGIEVDGEFADLEQITELVESTLADIYDPTISEDEFTKKHNIPRAESEKVIHQLLKTRESELVAREFILNHPEIQIVDGEKGIYAITLKDGEKLYGSIYSILDTDVGLRKMAGLAREIQSDLVDSRLGAVMALKTHEGDGFRSVVVASGSFAQGEIHEHPSDLDFSEHLDVHADSVTEAGKKLSALVQETILDASDNPEMEFSELKCGIYPEDAPETITLPNGKIIEVRGKAIKWSQEEVSIGEKSLIDDEGNLYQITLAKASENPGMIKIDWYTITTGELKELTKVINLRVINHDGEVILSNRADYSAFQEIYFGDISDFRLTELLSEPQVMSDYLAFLKSEVEKYSSPDHSNFLKVAKRAYKLLTTRGDLAGARSIAELFFSQAAEIGEKTESLDLIDDYSRKQGKFELDLFAGQIDELVTSVSNNEGLFDGQDQATITSKLSELKDCLLSETHDIDKIVRIVDETTPILRNRINTLAKEFLDGNAAFQELIRKK